MSHCRLKIFAPIDRLAEALPLIRAGADEFFCGVMIGDKNLSSIRVRDTKKCNLSNLRALEGLVRVIKANEKKIYVAFNSPGMASGQKKVIEKNIKKIKTAGIDGVILDSVELIKKFRDSGFKAIASSFFGTLNEETIKFLKEIGVRRIILDRQISLKDLKAVRGFPEMEFEAFTMGEACRSLPGFCINFLVFSDPNFWKNPNDIPRHICVGDFKVKNQRGKNCLSSENKKLIAERLKMPPLFLNCAACALFDFRGYRITSLKIVGRGRPTDIKIRNVKFIKAARDILEENYSRGKFYRKTQELFEKTFGHKCERRYCYYPHFFD